MTMHVNPIASNGHYTIGYDADGAAGQWPGNMTETSETRNWLSARLNDEIKDRGEWWTATADDGGKVVWHKILIEYRACYYLTPDQQGIVRLTSEDEQHLPDEALIASAVAEAHHAGLITPDFTEDFLRAHLEIGRWRE